MTTSTPANQAAHFLCPTVWFHSWCLPIFNIKTLPQVTFQLFSLISCNVCVSTMLTMYVLSTYNQSLIWFPRSSLCLSASRFLTTPPTSPFPQIQVTHVSVLRRVLTKKNPRHFLTPSCTPPVFQGATFDARVALKQQASAYYHSPSWIRSACAQRRSASLPG